MAAAATPTSLLPFMICHALRTVLLDLETSIPTKSVVMEGGCPPYSASYRKPLTRTSANTNCCTLFSVSPHARLCTKWSYIFVLHRRRSRETSGLTEMSAIVQYRLLKSRTTPRSTSHFVLDAPVVHGTPEFTSQGVI
jgi:hypothetical protein